MTDWPFVDGQKIVGMKVLAIVDWVMESIAHQPNSSSSSKAIIALPPMQRSAVWRPKQVVDLWDSIMRGLPIGMFYLTEPGVDAPRVTLSGDRIERGSGFDLLDGQQRLRALLIGVSGFSQEKRCLWLDLDPKGPGSSSLPHLYITSNAQPFGYDYRKGTKLGLEDRKEARKKFDAGRELMVTNAETGPRVAYDRELYDSAVLASGKSINQPPLPYKASEHTFKLHYLLHAWRQSLPGTTDAGITALRAAVGEQPSKTALVIVNNACENIANAEVALLRVDPARFRRTDDVLHLFERIGAGGTPLSIEDQLYSIYKFHQPYIRDAVDRISVDVGRVLSSTNIAATALRIANAQTHKNSNDTPTVLEFSTWMADASGDSFRNCLGQLLRESRNEPDDCGFLLGGFKAIKRLLSYDVGAGNFWLPDIMLVSLPVELWQVLVFWAIQNPTLSKLTVSRAEVVRFALFWHLSVRNKDKAARAAFALIKKHMNDTDSGSFPARDLYNLFIGEVQGENYAFRLLSPEHFEENLWEQDTDEWRSDAERFGENGIRNNIRWAWWWSGTKMLPWLQRDYINREFRRYQPLTAHEDDIPYDVDHICPSSDWSRWGKLKNRLPDRAVIKVRVERWRHTLGNGIGNLRLINSSENRRDQDADVADKMNFILGDHIPTSIEKAAMADWAFAPEHRELWRKVSPQSGVKLADRTWDSDRLKWFQRVVEARTAWLYQRFHDDLEFNIWTSTCGNGLGVA